MPDGSSQAPQAPLSPSAMPVSPHLQIWGWTVTMASSIVHRATGVMLYAGVALIALWAIALAFSPPLYAFLAGIFASPLGIIILAGLCWDLVFHMLSGLKYLYWDAGRGLDYETAKKTAWGIFIAATVITAALVIIALNVKGAA